MRALVVLFLAGQRLPLRSGAASATQIVRRSSPMKLKCSCGQFLTDSAGSSPLHADTLPNCLIDLYCDTIESALVDNAEKSPDVASQFVVDRTTMFFRRMCQCPECGRVHIEDSEYQIHSFAPETTNVENALFARDAAV